MQLLQCYRIVHETTIMNGMKEMPCAVDNISVANCFLHNYPRDQFLCVSDLRSSANV